MYELRGGIVKQLAETRAFDPLRRQNGTAQIGGAFDKSACQINMACIFKRHIAANL